MVERQSFFHEKLLKICIFQIRKSQNQSYYHDRKYIVLHFKSSHLILFVPHDHIVGLYKVFFAFCSFRLGFRVNWMMSLVLKIILSKIHVTLLLLCTLFTWKFSHATSTSSEAPWTWTAQATKTANATKLVFTILYITKKQKN